LERSGARVTIRIIAASVPIWMIAASAFGRRVTVSAAALAENWAVAGCGAASEMLAMHVPVQASGVHAMVN
jgi:hypothetical protein